MPQIPPEVTTPPAIDAEAIGKLIREEIDRANKYLEFSQGQIERDRMFFKISLHINDRIYHHNYWCRCFLFILVRQSDAC